MDLLVDLPALAEMRDELAQLIEEFDRSEEIAADSEIGARDVLSALHEFATNWKVHKKDLLKEMSAVHKMIESSHHTYGEADSSLAKDVGAGCTR